MVFSLHSDWFVALIATDVIGSACMLVLNFTIAIFPVVNLQCNTKTTHGGILSQVITYACFAISCETFQAGTLITPMCVDTLAAYIRTVVNEVAFVDVCGY